MNNTCQFWTTIALHDGNFVIVWQENNDVWARKINTTGTIIQEWIVNSGIPNTQEPTDGVSLTDGRFIIAFQSYPKGLTMDMIHICYQLEPVHPLPKKKAL